MKKVNTLLVLSVCLFFSTYANAVNLDSIAPGRLLKYAKRVRYGINTDVDLLHAAKIYMFLAKRGNVDAQRELGDMFMKGEGVAQNYSLGRTYLKKACLAGDPKAMCMMGNVYQRGVGVRTNQRLAFRLYLAAAQKGESHGYYGVGNMLYKGIGVRQDYKMAEMYLLKGSEEGNAKCDFLLANYYAYGFGGTSDYEKAKSFLNKAVKNGHGWTVDMTLFNKLDSVMQQNAIQLSKTLRVRPNNVEKVTKVLGTSEVIGTWSGSMLTYDWSNTRVLKEEPIEVVVSKDSCLLLTCIQNDSVISVFSADEQIENKWRKIKVRQQDLNFKWIPLSCSFETTTDGGKLYIQMKRLSSSSRSVLKPVQLTLMRAGATTGINDNFIVEDINISPLPIKSDYSIFVKSKKAITVNVYVYDLNGMRVADYGNWHLNVGSNKLSCHSNLPSGIYILKVRGKGVDKSLKVLHL